MPPDKQLIVDPSDKTCFATIGEAIADALDGEKILVRPGEYRENLIVDKQIHIAGDGAIEDVRILGDGVTPVITSRSPLLNLRNLSLANVAGKVPTIECEEGICDVMYCSIQGGNYGVSGLPGTRLSVDNSSIAGSFAGGIFGQECIGLSVADTLIEKCNGSGIIAEDCQEIFIERCTIMDVTPHGIEANGGEAFEVKDTEIIGVPSAPILDNGEPVNEGLERVWYERRLDEEEEEQL